MTDYLTVFEVAVLQRDLIDRYGGEHGIRDRGALDAACYRPQSGYYGDVVEEAAALMESLAMNRPFVDGNKRIAFAAAYTFLRINGYKITAPAMGVYDFMMSLFENKVFTIDKLQVYLRENTSQIR